MSPFEGRIESAVGDSADVCILRLRQVRGILSTSQPFTVPGPFSFTVPAGAWTLDGFIDTDGDGYWMPGELNPYRSPEPRTIRTDTLDVRSRFTLEDILVRF